jgi:MtN3 and saliva related transmembrane protein
LIALSKTYANSFGYIAAFCTTIAFVPQVISVLRTKSARDISLSMVLIFTFGVATWLIYGLLMQSPPVIAANVVTLVLAIWLLVLKLRYTKTNEL